MDALVYTCKNTTARRVARKWKVAEEEHKRAARKRGTSGKVTQEQREHKVNTHEQSAEAGMSSR